MKTATSAVRALWLCAAACAAATAGAQEASTGIVADRLRPALGPTTLAGVEGADTTPRGRLGTMLALGYLRDPIMLRSRDGALVARAVAGQLVGHFGFEVGLPRGFALRASLPVVVVNDGDRLRGTGVGGAGNDPGPRLAAAVGDLQLGAKVALIGAPTRPGLHGALALDVTVPLGGQAHFAATDGVTVAPRLLVDYRLPWLTLALDASVRFARERRLFDALHGDELVLGGGVIGRLASLGQARRWHLVGYVEAQGIVGRSAGARPVEVRAALRLAGVGGLDVDVGGGAGLVDAVGAPRFRLFVLLRAPLPTGR